MSKNKAGLVVGSFIALMHLVWSIAVAVIPNGMQVFISWIINLHHLRIPIMIVTPFILMNAVILIIMTFVFGYIYGWIFAAIYNLLKEKNKKI